MDCFKSPSPKRAILFRYHDHPDVCANRIEILRHLNPHTPIYGMYGGSDHIAPRHLALDADYALPFPDAQFKWEHGDLCVRQWFIDQGHTLDFDMIHVVEWDLLLLAPIEDLFAHIKDGVAVSNRLPLSQLRDEGWGWITDPRRAAQFDELCALIEKRHSVKLTQQTVMAGAFATAALSRTFLERYAAEDIPALTHDEIRMTTFAAAYGLPVHDTNVTQGNPFWNCEKAYFTAEDVAEAIDHHKVIHPVRDIIGPDIL